MTEPTQFTIGVDVTGTDGACGQVGAVVVDPVARAVTHLVVEPKHRQGLGRLVPLSRLDAAGDRVRFTGTVAEFDQLDPAEEAHFLAGDLGAGDYGEGQVLAWPYYGLSGLGLGAGVGDLSLPIVYDTIPLGEVEVRRGERVHATDGDIGRVQGLVIEPDNHHVTHVLLQEGHLWGRKEVAIPISAVSGVNDGIRLTISKQEVQDLPAVDLAHPQAERPTSPPPAGG